MKMALRFIVPLGVFFLIVAYGLTPLVNSMLNRWFTRDLDVRARLISTTAQESIEQMLSLSSQQEARQRISRYLKKVTEDERLMAIGFCLSKNELFSSSELFPKSVNCASISELSSFSGVIETTAKGDIHVAKGAIQIAENRESFLVLVHDLSFITRRLDTTHQYLFALFLTIGVGTSLLAVLVARWSFAGWVRSLRALLNREKYSSPSVDYRFREFLPILKDVRSLMRELEENREIQEENRFIWNPATLKNVLSRELLGEKIFVLSNREPYIHNYLDGKVEVQTPASGLVTAVEPILRACSGTWIAHGSGSADRDVVDKNDRIKVPPENPQYDIHRIWLNQEEEAGYYYGFSNEGLWPLCHFAHTRPIFRKTDWEHYVKVNKKFAEALLRDATTEDPVLLVQDYHLALVPQLVREHLPHATIITFWHIPWPTAESFGICPWREEILYGLMGSSILGFHTQSHCNNFIETVDRYLECRIDRESHSIVHTGQLTAVRPYPISIEWPPRWLDTLADTQACEQKIRMKHGFVEDLKIGIGVDRLDYTKGILERFFAIERFLEMYPEWVGKFTFVQIAAPSRSHIETYQSFENEVKASADRINARFGSNMYKPILLLVEHHQPEQVFEYFRAANLCFVSSLHDGMNLVAKEYIAAKEDLKGVLILSMFTGASRELPEALIVNPYNIEQCAEALHHALSMTTSEQEERMRVMRAYIREYNVFRWAGRMLLDAARVRVKNQFARRRPALVDPLAQNALVFR